MTQGSILRALIFFAIPVLIGNVFQQLYNVADTAIIGNILGDDALASVGAASPVYNLLIGFSNGLTNGFSVVIARHFGAGDDKQMRKAVSLTYILSAIIATVITVGGVLSIHPLMKALKTPNKIISDTESYMRIIVLFSVTTIAYNMFASMLRAIGNSRVPLYFLVISTFVNIGLDFLFVKGFSMGVNGAAYATVISQGISALLCMIYVVKKCRPLVFRFTQLELDKPMLADLVSTGLSMGLMLAIVSIGSVILQGAVNSLGTSTITAHSAARKIDEIFMLPLSTVSLTCSTFTSQNYGAGNIDRVKQGIRYGFIISAVWSVISMLICLVLRVPIIRALTGSEDSEVINAASRYIILNVSFFLILSVLLVLRSSLQGLGRKIVPIFGSVIEFAMKIFAVAVLAPNLGYLGVCISEPIIWAICAVIVSADYIVFLRKNRNGKLTFAV